MNLGRSWLVPGLLISLPALVGGCLAPPDIDSDPLVVTETSPPPGAADYDPERSMAVAQIRESARAGDDLPYPDVFQAEQTRRLAARPEPRGVSTVQSLEAELAAISRRQAGAVSDAEIAQLRARAAELRRLADQARAAAPR